MTVNRDFSFPQPRNRSRTQPPSSTRTTKRVRARARLHWPQATTISLNAQMFLGIHGTRTPIPPAAICWGWCKSRNDSWSENDEWHASVTAGLLRFAWKWSGDLWQTLSFHFFAGLLPSGPVSMKSILSLWEAVCVRVKTRNFEALPQSNTPSRPDDTGYCSIGSGESESTSKLWNYQANSSVKSVGTLRCQCDHRPSSSQRSRRPLGSLSTGLVLCWT